MALFCGGLGGNELSVSRRYYVGIASVRAVGEKRGGARCGVRVKLCERLVRTAAGLRRDAEP